MKVSFKLLCASIFMLGASVTYAERATVIDGSQCTGFVPNVEGNGFGTTIYTNESHAVVTASGSSIVTCHFDHVEYLPHATGLQGFMCGVDGVPTMDSMMFANPGGKATMICKITGNS